MSRYFLYAHDRCDRCGELTTVRALSFFTDETLCMACLAAEGHLKAQLRDAGIELSRLEGCGIVPRFVPPDSGRMRSAPEPVPAPVTDLPGTKRDITEEDVRSALRRLRARSALMRIAPGPDVAGRGLPPTN